MDGGDWVWMGEMWDLICTQTAVKVGVVEIEFLESGGWRNAPFIAHLSQYHHHSAFTCLNNHKPVMTFNIFILHEWPYPKFPFVLPLLPFLFIKDIQIFFYRKKQQIYLSPIFN